MKIKKYEMFSLQEKLCGFSYWIDMRPLQEDLEELLFLREFILCFFGEDRIDVLAFIQGIKAFKQKSLWFKAIGLYFDHQAQLVYLVKDDFSKLYTAGTATISALVYDDNYVELCKIDATEHIIMSFDNLFELLITFDEICNQLSSFVIIYQDYDNWYHVAFFDEQAEMQKFVTAHTEPKVKE
jgi:hypothetical protein